MNPLLPDDKRTGWVRLASRALHPDFKQFFVCFSSAKRLGIEVLQVWSPNSAAEVEEAFYFNEYERGLEIHFVLCPGAN